MVTYELFTALRSFDNRRRYNRTTYLDFVKSQERFKGSAGYQKDIAAAAEKRKAADAEARAAAATVINECLQKMQAKAGQLALEAPTAEMVNILQVLNMKTRENRPSKQLLDMAAQAMNGNYLALSALDDLADRFYPKTNVKGQPDRFHPNYSARATGINAETISKGIENISAAVKEILNSPVDSAFVNQARMREHKYGAAFNIDDLPQRKELSDEREFYQGIIPAAQYDLFMKAVNEQ